MDGTQKRIEELQTILEITKLLNSSSDVKYILNALMIATLHLLKRADIGVIFLYNKKSKVLELKSSIGFGDIEMNLEPGESITGTAFNLRRTIHLKNHEEMMEMMDTMEYSKREILDSKIDQSMTTIQSSISCPLMHGDDCIGVFVIDNYEGKDPLTKEDVYLAELISLHATIAIVNAENYEREIENQKSLKRYSYMIEQEKNRYEYSTYLHNKFTEMVLNGRNVSDVLKEVSLMLKRDVFIINLFNTISHYALSFFTNIDELISEQTTFISKLIEKKEFSFYSDGLSLWIFFNPITVNQEILGWIGVASDLPVFSELEKITLDKCATITALEILKNNELANMEQSLKGDFFDNLLEEQSTGFINKFAKKFNYNFNKNHQILITKVDFSTIEPSLHKNLGYLYVEINKIAALAFTNSITMMKRNYIITIFDRDRAIDRSKIINLINEIFNKVKYVVLLSEMECNCKVVVSEIIDKQINFKLIYENAMQLFDLQFDFNENYKYYFYEDLEIKKFLLRNDKIELESFVYKVMGPLIEYNNASKEELFNTLKTYIISGGNWTLTKDILHIHGNTLTYRINRLKEILGFDLSNYYERFKLQIAFEIIDLIPKFKI